MFLNAYGTDVTDRTDETHLSHPSHLSHGIQWRLFLFTVYTPGRVRFSHGVGRG
jgi:hypothetical protein